MRGTCPKGQPTLAWISSIHLARARGFASPRLASPCHAVPYHRTMMRCYANASQRQTLVLLHDGTDMDTTASPWYQYI